MHAQNQLYENQWYSKPTNPFSGNILMFTAHHAHHHSFLIRHSLHYSDQGGAKSFIEGECWTYYFKLHSCDSDLGAYRLVTMFVDLFVVLYKSNTSTEIYRLSSAWSHRNLFLHKHPFSMSESCHRTHLCFDHPDSSGISGSVATGM